MSSVQKKMNEFFVSLSDNRMLDLYLKYMGIKMLTTATLVPFGLIMGKQYMRQFINETRQTGGANLDNLPVVDDALFGNYLKLSGLSTLSFSPTALIPLGTLMLIHHMYTTRSQSGGALNTHIKNLWGNRVLDLFAKYQGIKLLTSSTMVPFALIYGKDYLRDFFETTQKGGAKKGLKLRLPTTLPLVDDPLLGNYLKLSGLSVLSLTPGTLIPLGLLATLYHLYADN